MPTTPAHYLWVGPKPEDGKKGMDTMGVDLMREKYPEQEIHFWCLDSEVKKYKAHYDSRHGRDNITIHGIEAYIKAKGDVEYHDFVETLKQRAKQFPDRKHKVQEWITIKDSLDYYLQQYLVGVILDSSISPDERVSSDTALFSNLTDFTVPCFSSTSIAIVHDPWFIRTDPDSPKAKERFKNYFYEVKLILDDLIHDDQHEPQAHDIVRDSVTELFIKYVKDAPVTYTVTPHSGMHLFHGVKKIYLNTHKTQGLTSKRHPLFSLLQVEAMREMLYYMSENGIDPFTPLPYAYLDENRSIVETNRSIIGVLTKDIHECIKDREKTRLSIASFPKQLADKIKLLTEQGEIKASSAEPPKVKRRLKPKPMLRINIPGFPKEPMKESSLPLFEAGREKAEKSMREMDPQLKLKKDIEVVRIDFEQRLKLAHNSLISADKRLNQLHESIGRFASMSTSSKAMTSLLILPNPSLALHAFLDAKMKLFSVGGDKVLFLETFSALKDHLYTHLETDAPDPIISIEDLSKGLSTGLHAKTIRSLVNIIFSLGPISEENQIKYARFVKDSLAQDHTDVGDSLKSSSRFFQSDIKKSYNPAETNAFLQEMIVQLGPLQTASK